MAKRTLTFLGILFLSFGIIAFINALVYYNASLLFWICYSSLVIIGIGMLTKRTALIKSQLYILAIPDAVWALDFAFVIITGSSLFGIVDYFFMPGALIPKIVSLQHLFAIPALFYALMILPAKKEHSWTLSMFQIILMYGLTRAFTPAALNINCVYRICGQTDAAGPWYGAAWIGSSLLMIYLSRTLFKTLHPLIKRQSARGRLIQE